MIYNREREREINGQAKRHVDRVNYFDRYRPDVLWNVADFRSSLFINIVFRFVSNTESLGLSPLEALFHFARFRISCTIPMGSPAT